MILGGGDISDFSFSKAWGVNPAAASGTVIIDTSGGGSTSFSLAVGDYVTYSFGSVASFTGVVSEVGTVTEWARGLVQSFQVVDNRVRLSWQAVFAAWNIEDDYYSKSMARPVSPSTGSDSSDSGDDSVDITGTDSETLPAVLAPPIAAAPAAQWAMRRRYKHLLPEHWESGTWTWTDAPLTVKQILNSAFNHAWGDYGFTRSYHASMATAIVTGLDYTQGVKLSNLISELNSKTGLDVHLSGARTLTWARKGVGLLPIPDSSATPIASASSMTSVDTRIRVVGERVRIQVLNVELEPDWNRSYDKWIDELAFLRDIATIFSKPTATKADMCNLAAFAREVTLGDLAYKTMSDPAAPQYHDFRDFGKISRNNLPVWVYIRELVYRSYRIPEDFTYCGVPLSSIDIAEGLLLGTDIQDGDESGAHAFQVFAQTPTIYYPPVHASAICKGQPLDLLNARDIRLFYRGATRDLSNVWSIAPQFEVDPLGKSIRFHVPTFIDGDPAEGKSIYLLPNRGEGGGTDISGDVPVDSDYLDVAVPNPDFEISPAEVRASFTFLFGRFYRDFGSGPRRGAYHSPGLDMHLIDSFSCGLYTDPGIGSIDSSAVRLPDTSLSLFQEVLYEDGGGALAKAAAVASPLLALSPTQATGGFTRHGIAGTSLSPVIDRVSVSINVPEAVTERVEFTKARSTAIPLAERTLQRIQRTEEVFSGQDALKRESREYRVLATQVSSQAKTEARARTHRAFTDVFEKPVGSEGGASALVMDRDSITFKAGDIVWLDDKGQPSTKGGTFGGIAVADTKGQQMYIAHSGRVPVRVAGPVPVGALVMGAPGDKTGRAIGPVTIGRLAHGQSVSEYITGGLVMLDVSEPVPSCRFRVTFDYAQQRLYVGQGALGLINPAHTVLPIEPTLDGKLLADIPWWSISGVSVSTDYVVICRYSHGVVTMIFRPASVVPSLDSGEIEWIIAKVRFLLDGTKFVVQSLTQLWWSDITIVFDDDSPPYDDDIITVVKQADIGTSGHERPQVKVTEAVVGIIHTYTVQGNGVDGSLIIKDCEGHDLLRLAWRDGLIVKDSATFPSGNADTVLRLRTCAEVLSSLPLV